MLAQTHSQWFIHPGCHRTNISVVLHSPQPPREAFPLFYMNPALLRAVSSCGNSPHETTSTAGTSLAEGSSEYWTIALSLFGS
mmetsp:Transcript_21250/g.47943  ORF Transcript_21250/g.47943 Transcript_21250/m.47943 type:complete len:83 (-) Transcript_21250:317-565(-)